MTTCSEVTCGTSSRPGLASTKTISYLVSALSAVSWFMMKSVSSSTIILLSTSSSSPLLPWHLFLCLHKLAFLLYLSPHAVHKYGRSPVCAVSWSFRSLVWENLRSQGGWRQLYRLLSPAWIRSCAVRLHLAANLLLQTAHWKGRSFVWVLSWRTAWLLAGNT